MSVIKLTVIKFRRKIPCAGDDWLTHGLQQWRRLFVRVSYPLVAAAGLSINWVPSSIRQPMILYNSPVASKRRVSSILPAPIRPFSVLGARSHRSTGSASQATQLRVATYAFGCRLAEGVKRFSIAATLPLVDDVTEANQRDRKCSRDAAIKCRYVILAQEMGNQTAPWSYLMLSLICYINSEVGPGRSNGWNA